MGAEIRRLPNVILALYRSPRVVGIFSSVDNKLFKLDESQKPLLIRRRELDKVFASPRLVQRMLKAGWFTVIVQGGRGCDTLIDHASILVAFNRLKLGELPPLLPCEIKRIQAASASIV